MRGGNFARFSSFLHLTRQRKAHQRLGGGTEGEFSFLLNRALNKEGAKCKKAPWCARNALRARGAGPP